MQRVHGDIDVVCMTAPFGDGETEILSPDLIGVSDTAPNNGDAETGNHVLFCQRQV